MPRRKLTTAEANRAIGMLQAGSNQSEVARMFQVSNSVISRLKSRFENTGDVSERPRTGRPRKTTGAQDRFITLSVRREPLSTCRQIVHRVIETHGIQICKETVRTRLASVNLKSRRLLRRVPLTRNDMAARLAWATERLNWGEEWRNVLFTDESRYGRFSDSRRVRVWTLPRVPRNQRQVQVVYPYKGGTTMVWGGICFNGRTDLHICQGNMNGFQYQNQIINNILPMFRAAIGEQFVFLDDNARPHRTAAVLNDIERLRITHLQLPPRSPDLNCIEHAWDMLQRRLDEYVPHPNTILQLQQVLPRIWSDIPQEYFNTLIDSMHRRCQAIIDVHGGYTTY